MADTDVTWHVFADHRGIRRVLDEVDEIAWYVIEGRGELAPSLRDAGERLHDRCVEHLAWEAQHLRPALPSGERLDADHRAQRELLGYVLRLVQDGCRPPEILARNLLDLSCLLRSDMEDEEHELGAAPLDS